MSKFAHALTLVLALPFAQTAMAQTATTPAAPAATGTAPATSDAAGAPATGADKTPAPDAAGAKADSGALSMGKSVKNKMYVKDKQGDWTVRCFRAKDNKDPCELYQLLTDEKGNPVSEFSMVPLPPGGQAVAGATIVTPLETLLTQDVTIAIDGGGAKRYPFMLCNPVGCFSRIGLTQQDLDGYKKGAKGSLTIVAASAPNAPITLPISLKGFTAAYEEVQKNNKANGINTAKAPVKK
ncbi:invasion associated family protein [Defluviimonas sp. 20V17]|uniref:Invasion protein IalB, involved in pathogenesis n=1 Tax=Allgaiera indica TaxID=765699 RepID=A0AAN4UPZ0_9RHOB|nr:invasion associated locus B family protein [Allgaiera indica]KDB03264.1 invasion associated family protein [Defluviimonas sp. 20V17]GHE00556.1 hypothetical protein GCM10008024_12540 [Allgaiera indica]SDW59793.1 Invasion protein IalB, involved in pathogenesis [Allgaiera indica]